MMVAQSNPLKPPIGIAIAAIAAISIRASAAQSQESQESRAGMPQFGTGCARVGLKGRRPDCCRSRQQPNQASSHCVAQWNRAEQHSLSSQKTRARARASWTLGNGRR